MRIAHTMLLSPVLILLLSSEIAAQEPDVVAATDLFRAQNWTAAATAFRRLVARNPYDGTLPFYLGTAEARAGRCAEAVASLRQAIALGVDGTTSAMRQTRLTLAECSIATGDTTSAIAQVDTAWRRHGLRDIAALERTPGTARLAALPAVRALSGRVSPEPTSEPRRWEADLEYLDRLVRLTHPAPFARIPEAQWAHEVADLRTSLNGMTDLQRVGALMRLAALVGDGHTAVYPPFVGEGSWTLLPIFPVWLADGWHIGAADPAHRQLVGAKIMGAGALNASGLENRAREMIAADNHVTAQWLAQIPLQAAEFYAMIGAAERDGRVALRLSWPDGRTETAILGGEPLTRDPNARWAPTDWPTMSAVHPPRWIRHAAASAAMEWLDKERVLYVALNAIADTAGRPLAALGAALRDSILARDPAGVVLDLRLNNGGNGNLVPRFLAPLTGLPVLQHVGTFQVLTGPRSFSATGFLLGELERSTAARRVGGPTGVRPVVSSTETPFTMPYSGLKGTIATRIEVKGRDADDRRPTFAPHVMAWPTAAQLREGADPVLDAALARIDAAMRARRQATRPAPSRS